MCLVLNLCVCVCVFYSFAAPSSSCIRAQLPLVFWRDGDIWWLHDVTNTEPPHVSIVTKTQNTGLCS